MGRTSGWDKGLGLERILRWEGVGLGRMSGWGGRWVGEDVWLRKMLCWGGCWIGEDMGLGEMWDWEYQRFGMRNMGSKILEEGM